MELTLDAAPRTAHYPWTATSTTGALTLVDGNGAAAVSRATAKSARACKAVAPLADRLDTAVAALDLPRRTWLPAMLAPPGPAPTALLSVEQAASLPAARAARDSNATAAAQELVRALHAFEAPPLHERAMACVIKGSNGGMGRYLTDLVDRHLTMG